MTDRPAGSVVILSGAGISAESGLETFRDPDGIWAKYDIAQVATPAAFRRDPALVHDFYNARRRQLLSGSVRPNAAHEALARWEQRHRGDFLLVTQNIDDLHERAGSRRLLHMHGELLKSRCGRSGAIFDCRSDLHPREPCPCCGAAGALRPHVVWFGEMPLFLERIQEALLACDLFVAVGTSGSVHPAAGFVEVARRSGRARAVELNLTRTEVSDLFDETLLGKAGEVVPRFVAERSSS